LERAVTQYTQHAAAGKPLTFQVRGGGRGGGRGGWKEGKTTRVEATARSASCPIDSWVEMS
jgi:hypothetical protein